jgi:CspA family cold shock protein
VPTGKVKWYDQERGFGFIAGDDDTQVFLHASALPVGVEALAVGTRVDYGVADGKKGPSALAVQLLEAPATVTKAKRKPAPEMAVIVETLIKVLDGIGDELKGTDTRKGRYPDAERGGKVALLLRAVADDLEG